MNCDWVADHDICKELLWNRQNFVDREVHYISQWEWNKDINEKSRISNENSIEEQHENINSYNTIQTRKIYYKDLER